MNIKPRSTRVGIIIAIVVIGVLGASAYAVRSYAVPVVKQWRVKKTNEEARAFLAKGDVANTLLLARKTLAIAPQNVDAWRIGVAAAKLRKTAEVVVWQDNLCRVEPTKQNYLELIRVSLEYHALYYAVEAIKATAKESASDAEYQRLAVAVYEAYPGRAAAVKAHLWSLSSLVPNDRQVQLKLAAIEIAEDTQRTNRDVRSRLRGLADDPALRAQAWSLLLRDAIDTKTMVETTELVSRLKALPDLTVDQQLLVIEGSMLVARDSVDDLLERLKAKVAESPAETVRVLEFLRRTGASRQAWTWYQKLPEKTRLDENVLTSVGEALFTLQDWTQLDNFARSGNWGNFNYLRQAFIAYANRALGRKAEFNDAWKLAVIEAGSSDKDVSKAGALLARVDKWKWLEERYDVERKIFALMPRDERLRQDLIGWERLQKNTANLNKMFATIAQLEPNNTVNRNNLAYTSLLLNSNIGQAGLIADELVKIEPSNPYFATTRSLSLYKQGKFQEALEQIQALGFADRSISERVLLQALYLAKAGDVDRATDLLAGLNVEPLLNEEKKLRELALEDIARANRTQGNRNKLQAMRRGPESGGWLGWLDPVTQHDATVDMQLADAAYASGDFAGMADMLSKSDWGAYQYLNSALLTYVRRQASGAEAARALWSKTLTLADKNIVTLRNLRALVSQWGWEAEKTETLSRLFEYDPKDRLILSELLKNARDSRKVSNILKILSTHLASIQEVDSDERADFAYYSLLAEQNTLKAQVAAKQAYDVEPDNVKRGLVQAFSLYKQKRYSEAATVLKPLPQNVQVENIPRALIEAAVEAEAGSVQKAKSILAAFDPKVALAEEAALADQVGQRIAARERDPK